MAHTTTKEPEMQITTTLTAKQDQAIRYAFATDAEEVRLPLSELLSDEICITTLADEMAAEPGGFDSDELRDAAAAGAVYVWGPDFREPMIVTADGEIL